MKNKITETITKMSLDVLFSDRSSDDAKRDAVEFLLDQLRSEIEAVPLQEGMKW